MYSISSLESDLPEVALIQKPLLKKRFEHSCLKFGSPAFVIAFNKVETSSDENAYLADSLNSFNSLSLSDRSLNQSTILFQNAML